MSILSRCAPAALVLSLSATAAQAASFDLWRSSGTRTQSSFSFLDPSGISLTITGGTFTGLGSNAPLPGLTFGSVVHQSVWGMSVLNGSNDAHELDGSGTPEFLRFTFTTPNGRPVTLKSVSFTSIDSNDTFDFGIDGVDVDVPGSLGSHLIRDFAEGPLTLGSTEGSKDWLVSLPAQIVMNQTGSPTRSAAGSFFDFYPNFRNDNWKIAQIVVDIERSGTLGPIPLPGALPLLLGGLGALALVRRRRPTA